VAQGLDHQPTALFRGGHVAGVVCLRMMWRLPTCTVRVRPSVK
jgi:hypothetical protein